MSDITINEFLAIRGLLNGVEEDYYVAISNLYNLEFNDRELVNLLLVKSLQGESRKRFLKWSNYWSYDPGLVYTYQKLMGKNISSEIRRAGGKPIYKQILRYIMNT